jgi:hypothetical protein
MILPKGARRWATYTEKNRSLPERREGTCGERSRTMLHPENLNGVTRTKGSATRHRKNHSEKRGMTGDATRYVQPVKSNSFGVTVAPGLTFSGFPLASKLVVFDGGMQSVVPPLIGTNAFASTE